MAGKNRRTKQIKNQPTYEVFMTTLKSFMVNQAAQKETGINLSLDGVISNYRG